MAVCALIGTRTLTAPSPSVASASPATQTRTPAVPRAQAAPLPTTTTTPTPPLALSGVNSDALAGTAQTPPQNATSYGFVAAASGTVDIGSCITQPFSTLQPAILGQNLQDPSGAVVATTTMTSTTSPCGYMSAPVTAGVTYRVATSVVQVGAAFASAWSINHTTVQWPVNLPQYYYTQVPFVQPWPGTVAMSLCGQPGSAFVLSLQDAAGVALASAPSQQSCAAVGALNVPPGSYRLNQQFSASVPGVSTGAITETFTDPGTTPTASATTPPSTTATPTPTETATATATAMSTEPATATPGAALVLSRSGGVPFQSVTVTGTNYAPNEQVTVFWNSTATPLTTTITTVSGTFVATFTVPAAVEGVHVLYAVGQSSARSASATLTVRPAIFLSPSHGKAGSAITLGGFGFGAGETVAALWYPGLMPLKATPSNAAGSVTLTITVPLSPTGTDAVLGYGVSTKQYAATPFQVTAMALSPGRQWRE